MRHFDIRFLVPYLAVGIFWCLLRNGWLAILMYHVLILCFARGFQWKEVGSMPKRAWALVIPSVLAGPIVYLLMPHVAEVEVLSWLEGYAVSGVLLYLMIPYFGLIHPYIEQIHWAPLCEKTPVAHLFFSGYHILVLATLLPIPWLVVSFISLASVSWFWHWMRVRFETRAPSILSHTLADFGIVAFLVLGQRFAG